MVRYREVNVNPKHRKTGDCSTRALVGVLGASYDDVLRLQTKWALKTYYDTTSKQVVEKVLEEFGYVKMKQPRKWDNTKYLVGEIDDVLSQRDLDNGVIISMANHYTCVKGNELQDIWDCRFKSISNYWIKK